MKNEIPGKARQSEMDRVSQDVKRSLEKKRLQRKNLFILAVSAAITLLILIVLVVR